jgi:hypothetical protein
MGVTLFSGALDQLLKLDLIPAFLAVFLAGYTSNAIKDYMQGAAAMSRAAPQPKEVTKV